MRLLSRIILEALKYRSYAFLFWCLTFLYLLNSNYLQILTVSVKIILLSIAFKDETARN